MSPNPIIPIFILNTPKQYLLTILSIEEKERKANIIKIRADSTSALLW
jgi:hypothetical protein